MHWSCVVDWFRVPNSTIFFYLRTRRKNRYNLGSIGKRSIAHFSNNLIMVVYFYLLIQDASPRKIACDELYAEPLSIMIFPEQNAHFDKNRLYK